MENLKFVVTTKEFWDSLAEHRNHSRYPEIRGRIDWFLKQKASNRMMQIGGDSQFSSNAHLMGIGHCKLSTNPDVVMFYTTSGDTINLAMVGSHHDYPHQGKHLQKAEPLGRKIRDSVSRGHVASPEWRKIKWKTPDDILAHRELAETTLDELAVIAEILRSELDDGAIYRETTGKDLLDAEDVNVVEEWLGKTEMALLAVEQAQRSVRENRKANSPRTAIAAVMPSP